MSKINSTVTNNLLKNKQTKDLTLNWITFLISLIFTLENAKFFSQNQVEENSINTFIQANISPQVEKENAIQLSTIERIFDIKQPVCITTTSVLAKSDGSGTGRYITEKLATGDLNVRFTFNKPTPPNPMYLNYNFKIEPITNEGYAMDMKAALPPFVLYNDSTQLVLTYVGEKINFLPNEINRKLISNANGKFILKKIKTGEVFLTYEVAVYNRKFIKKENITIDGFSYEVYEHTYDFVQNTLINGNQVLSNYEQKVSELFIPNLGLVSQNRVGNQLTITSNGKNTTASNLQTTILHINVLSK